MAFLDREQLFNVMRGFNPWWTSGSVPRDTDKPIKRAAFYEIKRTLNHPSIRRIVFLSGARRVGKTTLMYQMIADMIREGHSEQKILYASFDHPVLKLFSIDEVIKIFIENVSHNDAGEYYFFFDEIQYAKDWDAWLKVLYDGNPNYRIMVTGSASPLVQSKAQESGVGRWITLKIPTLSFYEYIDLIQAQEKPVLPPAIKPTQLHMLERNELTRLIHSMVGLQKHFNRYLLIGGFPELALTDDMAFAQRVLREDVADKVLKRDLTALFGTRNVMELERLFLYLCLHSGGIIVQDVIAKEIGVSRQTVANYLSILEQANLIYVSHPVELFGKKILKSKPKVYVADAALRNAVLMLNESVLFDPIEMGTIIETAVYKHIATFYYADWPKIGYYREARKEKEVDIVVELPRGRIAVEVKYREDAALGRDEAIVELAQLPDTLGAVFVTKRVEDHGISSLETAIPIVRIPAFVFLYLLGHAERQHRAGDTK